MLLGDRIEQALKTVGISQERVQRWFGGLCSCDERREKINRFHSMVNRVLDGHIERAKEYFEEILK